MVTVVNVVTNVGIAFGYLFVATVVLPFMKVRSWVRYAGVAFFVTCGITHVDMAVGAYTHAHNLESPALVLNHVAQVIAVWVFVIGLYVEFVKDDQA